MILVTINRELFIICLTSVFDYNYKRKETHSELVIMELEFMDYLGI